MSHIVWFRESNDIDDAIIRTYDNIEGNGKKYYTIKTLKEFVAYYMETKVENVILYEKTKDNEYIPLIGIDDECLLYPYVHYKIDNKRYIKPAKRTSL